MNRLAQLCILAATIMMIAFETVAWRTKHHNTIRTKIAMARTFTTLFSFNGNQYTAVISQLDGAISIYVPDESLHDILPAGKATYHPAQGLKIDTPRLSPAQLLLLSILTSIEGLESGELKTIKEEK